MGLGVNTTKTEGFYPKKGEPMWRVVQTLDVKGVIRGDDRELLDSVTIRSTSEEDKKVLDAWNSIKANPGMYNLGYRNCAHVVEDALRAGGLTTPDTSLPRALVKELKRLQVTP